MAVNSDGVIRLPYQWQPRPRQLPLWNYLKGGGKRAIAIWHRRFGKDEVALHHTACAMVERAGNYVHLLPEIEQARKALWNGVNPHTGKRRIDEAFPPQIRSFTRDHEMIIGLPNNSTWQLGGSDRFNAVVGAGFAGITFSEWALSNPSSWSFFRPMVLENDGWALFITTPRGHNHAEAMLKSAKEQRAAGKDWFWEVLTNDDTGRFTQEQMANELKELIDLHGEQYGRSLWLQEYYCSFDAAIPGSIWGDCVEKARSENRIGVVPIEPGVPVHTGWDLGRTDDTAIWFYQCALGSIRVIDYHESNMKDIPFYANLLKTKARDRGFKYGTHWLPHDARPRTLAAGGKSILDQMQEQLKEGSEQDFWGACQIAPRLDREEGIQAARATFPHCWYDGERCADGIEKLRQYHREWDDEKKVFSMNPAHDFASHAADAWRTVAVTWNYVDAKQPEAGWHQKLTQSGIRHDTFGDLKKRHLSKRRSAREDASP